VVNGYLLLSFRRDRLSMLLTRADRHILSGVRNCHDLLAMWVHMK